MTKPPIGCTIDEMWELWREHASNYAAPCQKDPLPVEPCDREFRGRRVIAKQKTRFHNDHGTVAWVNRFFFAQGQPEAVDFPYYLRILDDVFVLTD